jgi:hypothetical protein
MLGALLGCGLGAAVVATATHSSSLASFSVVLAFVVGGGYWLATGSDSFGDKVVEVVFAAVLCGLGAGLGVAIAEVIRTWRGRS